MKLFARPRIAMRAADKAVKGVLIANIETSKQFERVEIVINKVIEIGIIT